MDICSFEGYLKFGAVAQMKWERFSFAWFLVWVSMTKFSLRTRCQNGEICNHGLGDDWSAIVFYTDPPYMPYIKKYPRAPMPNNTQSLPYLNIVRPKLTRIECG